ncbi:hypothetical protein M378DRAFT_560049 [Amanita muscaria Koide BX008]|uniref:Pheromone receptor n=1 Tax=Amanita muscaria (strain Koide BX008) TaxID=946122 RepID=A0A0C2WGV2_AMAMK|nr:hypothetical protein M378DRAFT_560049 [Amanita muscaria Koide BX008]
MSHHSSDPTYPSFPIISFLGFILALIPLSWHLQAWNVGTCAFMIWTSLACLFEFINSLVWAGNVLNPVPVWCDISSKYLLGAGVGITASTLCITRRLYRIANIPVVSHTRQEKLRAVYCDLSVAVGIPVLVMVLHYIVQPHRFDILEGVGCYAVVYNTLPAYFLVFHWPVTLGFISFWYSAMTLWAIWKRHIQMNELMTFHGPSLRKRYSRLVAFALTNMALTVPIGVFSIYLGTKGVKYAPWVSWSDTHFDFSRVDLVPTLVWRDGDVYSRISVELTRWIFPASSIIFFAFFGFTSESWFMKKGWSRKSREGSVLPMHVQLFKTPEDDRSSLSTVGKINLSVD